MSFTRLHREAVLVGMAITLLIFGVCPLVSAQSSSPHYQVDEAFFGTGGELDAASGQYMAKQSAGELTVGNAIGTQYQMQGGFNTTDVELLELAVNGGTYDLDFLDIANTHFTSVSFAVRNYLSSGYVVRIAGPPPSEPGAGHQLAPLLTPTNPIPGVEQFGINLVDNATPNVGSDPQQFPDASFGYGVAETGYDQPDEFQYLDGDIVASSSKSSGTTIFTVSVIANIANNTPAGSYGGSFSVIVVPTF